MVFVSYFAPKSAGSVLKLCLSFVFLTSLSIAPVEAVSQVSNDDLRRLLRQGDRLVHQGEFAQAEAVYRKLLGARPSDSQIALRLSYTLLKQRLLIEAYDLSVEVVKEEPKNARALSVLGTVLLTAGRFPEARDALQRSLIANRREALAWASLGMVDFYENQIEESLANLREAVFHSPRDPDFVFALAQVSARAERYNDAADAYNRFLRLSRSADDERRDRIRGLIAFLRYLGNRPSLYTNVGADSTVVDMSLIGNRPVILMKVNDRPEPLRFVLDTGSGITVISNETAERLGINPVARGGFARGIGGDGRFDIVYGFLRQVSVGDVRIRNVPVYIRQFHNQAHQVDGYIGLALISKFLTTIDYGNRTFQLERKGSGEFPNGELSVPLRLTSSGFLSGEVQLEGLELPLNFIVDTGASISVISDEVANLNPINTFEREEKLRVIGSAGVAEDVPTYLLPKVSFGKHSRSSIAAVALDLDSINRASGFQQAGILGGNFLRNFKMTFDFTNSRVTFVPVNGEP